MERNVTRHHSPSRNRPKLVALNTFTAHQPQGGGALRAFHLGRGLTQDFDVHLLSLTEAHHEPWAVTSAPGFTEIAVPRTAEHVAFEHEHGARIGIPTGDLHGGLGIHLTPSYLRQLRRLTSDADVVVLSHPYLEPALDLAGVDVPVVYDAYNVEVRLKDQMFPNTEAGDAAVRDVRRVEADTIAMSNVIAACSDEDRRMFEAVFGPTPPITVVPNGTDVDAIAFVHGSDRRRVRQRWLESMGADPATRIGVFLASWHQPNLDAAEVLHELAPEHPDVLFVMVGSHVHAFEGRQLPRNVLQMGLIGDATKRVLLAAADVGLNPMDTGSGTNLKMVEYLASGMMTLSTPIGARGLPPEAGDTYRLAELEDFSSALADLLRFDSDQPEEIDRALRARSLVEERYGWRPIAREWGGAILEHALGVTRG